MRVARKDIVPALDAMLKARLPGQVFSQGDIADGCGITRQAVGGIEQMALIKLKVRMRQVFTEEEMQEILARC